MYLFSEKKPHYDLFSLNKILERTFIFSETSTEPRFSNHDPDKEGNVLLPLSFPRQVGNLRHGKHIECAKN